MSTRWVETALYLLAASACFTGARLHRGERRAWLVFGLAIVAYGTADLIWWQHASQGFEDVPDMAQRLYATFYTSVCLGILLLLRARAGGFPAVLVLEGMTAGLAIAALGTALIFGPIAGSAGAENLSFETIGYSLVDVLAMGLLAAVMILAGRRQLATWLPLALAAAIFATADSIWAVQVTAGTYEWNGLLDSAWATAAGLIGIAALGSRPAAIAERGDAWRGIWMPSVFGSVALGVLVAGEFGDVEPLAVVFATLALAGFIARGAHTVHKRMQTVDALAASEERYRAVLRSLPDTVITLYDRDLRMLFADGDQLLEEQGLFPMGTRPWETVPPGERGLVESKYREALAGLFTWHEVDRFGRTWHVEVGPFSPDGKDVAGVIAVARDISERRAVEQQLERQALRDALTGLANRVLFIDRLQQALARLKRHPSTLGVFFIDLDRFKLVNDSLGHSAGDELLMEAGRRIRATVRPEDTVARFGGDEFVLICESLSNRAKAEEIGRRILTALAPPFAVSGHEVAVNASVGIVLTGDPEADPGAIIRDADTAMYSAKEKGRGRFEFFDAPMRTRVEERLALESALPGALARDEFRLVYQPQISLADGRVVGYEALLRWMRPDHGLISPADFIPIAEESGAIVEIGDWVFEQACRDRAQLPADVMVSVNLSPKQLASPGLVERFEAALERWNASPLGFCLEVTESALLADPEGASDVLVEFQELGLQLAIDDFGVGFSSLNQLRRLPHIDIIKVDRAFVAGLGRDPKDRAIVRSIVTLARSLGMRVIAEGVETPLQAEELEALGCDIGQGFWYAPPRPLTSADLVASVG